MSNPAAASSSSAAPAPSPAGPPPASANPPPLPALPPPQPTLPLSRPPALPATVPAPAAPVASRLRPAHLVIYDKPVAKEVLRLLTQLALLAAHADTVLQDGKSESVSPVLSTAVLTTVTPADATVWFLIFLANALIQLDLRPPVPEIPAVFAWVHAQITPLEPHLDFVHHAACILADDPVEIAWLGAFSSADCSGSHSLTLPLPQLHLCPVARRGTGRCLLHTAAVCPSRGSSFRAARLNRPDLVLSSSSARDPASAESALCQHARSSFRTGSPVGGCSARSRSGFVSSRACSVRLY